MRKKLLIIFCFLIICFTLNNLNVLATNLPTFDDSNNAGYRVDLETVSDLNGGVLHTNAKGVTIKSSAEYSQQVNVLTMKTSQEAKLVTWAKKNSSNSGFVRQSVASIAKDYELNHPGWTVMGGINADQYYTNYGELLGVDGTDHFYPQPYYPMIADYEKWFSISATPYGTGNIVGFTNDGSKDQLLYYNAGWGYNNEASDKGKIAGLFLTIIRDGIEVGKFKIENFNESPNDNESSVYSPYVTEYNKIPPIQVSGTDVYFVSNAQLAYTSNSVAYTYKSGNKNNQNAFFGKGIVSSKENQVTVNKGQFAIETKNQTIKDLLKVSDFVICQFEYEGLLNEVESGIGFHKIMRVDNIDKPMAGSGSYNTSLYPRAMFGRKDDGTIALVTVDGRQADKGMNGVNMEESNAILKHYGVVEAYQLDGGGSVTMIVKDGDEFKTVNSPSDGADRSVLNALLFVVKDIGVDTLFDVSSNKIVANVTKLDSNLDRIFMRINDETKEVINGVVEFENLEPNTSYKYEYLTFKDDKLHLAVKYGFVSTSKRIPNVDSVKAYYSNGEIIFSVVINDPDFAIHSKYIEFMGQSKSIVKNDTEFTVINIDINSVVIKLGYDLQDGDGRQKVDFNNIHINYDSFVAIGNIKNIIKEKVKGIYE